MRIKTTGDLVQDEIQLISLMPQAAAELREKKTRTADGEEGELKLAPNGQVQYRTPFKCMALQDGVPSREERNVSVTVLNRLDIKPAQYYRLDVLTGDVDRGSAGDARYSLHGRAAG